MDEVGSGNATEGLDAQVGDATSSAGYLVAGVVNVDGHSATVAGSVMVVGGLIERSGGSSAHGLMPASAPQQHLITIPSVQVAFCAFYVAVFLLGVSGNLLVCYVVVNNRAMQTVTNVFITNLALGDILLCFLSVPFTPLYSFQEEWLFGSAICRLVTYSQGVSIYVSTLTLTSIAVDRYFVIMHPFRERMSLKKALAIIGGVWAFSIVATLPYGIFTRLSVQPLTSDADGQHHSHHQSKTYCEEEWPNELSRHVFGASTTLLQFVLPFIIITFCYARVSIKMGDRIRLRPGRASTTSQAIDRLEVDTERKRYTNGMLIAMVAIFGCSWLPLNMVNLLQDVFIDFSIWPYSNFLFFVAHAIAMSSTCYNPILYAWLNKNFREEFRRVLPCFQKSGCGGGGSGAGSAAGDMLLRRGRRHHHYTACPADTMLMTEKSGMEKSGVCLSRGNDTVEESFFFQSTNSVRRHSGVGGGGGGGSGDVDVVQDSSYQRSTLRLPSVVYDAPSDTAHILPIPKVTVPEVTTAESV